MRLVYLLLVLMVSGCANDSGRSPFLDAVMGYTPSAPSQGQTQNQGYLPPFSMTGVLLGSMPSQTVTGQMGWSCVYQVTAATNTKIWLDHQCPPTMQFQ